jgi:hypothetical protein
MRPAPVSYDGVCGTCRTHWNVTVESWPDSWEPSEEIEIECPIPFCGLVKLHQEHD